MADNETNKVSESGGTKRPLREGSTRLPPFPVVHIVKSKVGKNPKLSFNEVPELRKEMKDRLFKIDRREKFHHDFKRTSQDFWRMELDRLNKIGEDNRRHMSAAIRVYLGQTHGSCKAIKSLIKHVEIAEQNTA
ncbi:uncharacterized protein LOC143459438 [Clavelina lepadiformis]|uniref:uncharacterized protein LOC143459438 n=1 Tax=Clavelina lepadiformis TaxID=159417 RepID=UPI0040414337